MGELNWIFTAITDTIAWNTLPRHLFQKLFRCQLRPILVVDLQTVLLSALRQDLLVASLFRNFLLAERVMRACNCTPVSDPPLPSAVEHPLWEAWDYALDTVLTPLKALAPVVGRLPALFPSPLPTPVAPATAAHYNHSDFFASQLKAFEVNSRSFG